MSNIRKNYFLILVLSLIILPFGFFSQVMAMPVLLSEINFGGGVGSSGAPWTLAATDGFRYFLAYGFPDFTLPQGGSAVCIGCDHAMTETPGSFDFNSGNSPEFTDFTLRATDGINELVDAGTGVLRTSGSLLTAFSGGNFENVAFGFYPDLIGGQIDFIRLIVTDVFLGPSDPSSSNPGFTYSSHGKWQIFGTPNPNPLPNPQPLPEPSTLLLFATGLLMMGGYEWRRESRLHRSAPLAPDRH